MHVVGISAAVHQEGVADIDGAHVAASAVLGQVSQLDAVLLLLLVLTRGVLRRASVERLVNAYEVPSDASQVQGGNTFHVEALTAHMAALKGCKGRT